MPEDHKHSVSHIPYKKGQYMPFYLAARARGYNVSAMMNVFSVHHPHDADIERLAQDHGLQVEKTRACSWINTCAYDRKLEKMRRADA